MVRLSLLPVLLVTSAASPGGNVDPWPGLRVQVELEHDVYFLGEDANVKLTVTNTSNRTLTIPTPFVPATGYLAVLSQRRRDFPDLFEPQIADQAPRRLARGRSHRTKLKPGESKTAVIRLWDACTGGGFTSECGLPPYKGRHRITYFYHYAEYAEFSIVQPSLEQWSEVTLPGKFDDLDLVGMTSRTPSRRVLSQRVWVAVIRHGAERYLVASRAQLVDPLTSQVPFTPPFLVRRTPYWRVAKLDSEVKGLQLERTEPGDLLVRYRLLNDQSRSLRIPADEVRPWKPK